MTLDEVCRFFGGSAPPHPATVYRDPGRYPRPVKSARTPTDGSAPNPRPRFRLLPRSNRVKGRDRAEVFAPDKAKQAPVEKATGERFALKKGRLRQMKMREGGCFSIRTLARPYLEARRADGRRKAG